MELTQRKWHKIATAIFDRFVSKSFIEKKLIIHGSTIKTRELNYFAKKLGCDAHSLSCAINDSCGRITSTNLTKSLSKEAETTVFLAVVKYGLKDLSISITGYRRHFGNITKELNQLRSGLNLKFGELLVFIYPIYLEVIEETFNN